MVYKRLQGHLDKRDQKLCTQIRSLEIVTKSQVEESILLFRCKQFSFLFLFLFLSICLGIIFSMKEEYIDSTIIIERNETGGGTKEVELFMKNDKQEIRYPFIVREIPYTKKQWEEKVKEAMDYVEKVMKGDNTSLDAVNRNLVFPRKAPNNGIKITYETNHRTWVDENGNVDVSEIKEEGELVEIDVIFRYEDFEEIRTYTIRLIPEVKSEEEKEYEEVVKKIKEKEENSLYQIQFELPNKIGDYIIENTKGWNKNQGVFLILVLGIGILFFFREEEQMKEQMNERKEQLLKDYPEFIHQLILLIGAGMTLKSAFIRLSENYKKKKQLTNKKHYLYEELIVTTYEFQAGLSEEEVYRNLANRIGLSSYKRIIELLIQNVKKGTKNLIEMLIREQESSLEMRKEQAKRLGEEAGTKLLMPMILLLGVVLLLVLYPAMCQFQFY
ncbi:MAG: type II secretion system F family protein [Firmicutes bacterium]|uniref:Type II secretion system F family protein n=1 Tax=Candidatus Scybalomonas excrementavium TaxID=2840943 RepID=A0A9D9N7W3_9FIRM|nr:type II secretion system F family protein [Candidatus Scybalomonas excrementavium]